MTERIELLPGVFLQTMQTDKFKTGCISVNFLRPLCREEASLNALLPSVLLRGTESRPDIREISLLLDELYGATVGTLIRKKGEVHSWGFYADFIEDAYALDGEAVFAEICRFLRELLFAPVLENGVFLESFVESEKVNLCNTLAAEINDKRSYATIRMMRTMCENERQAIPRLGEREIVEQITPQSLYAHFEKVLATSRVEILYMGRKSGEEAAELIRGMIEGLPRKELTEVGTDVIRSAAEVRELEERMEVTQGKLSMGFRTGCTCADPEYPALLLLNAVYGGAVSSKLFRNVREKLQLCYYASSSIEKYKGLMVVSSGIDFENYEVAKNEILHQLEDCRSGNITEEELEKARQRLISGFRSLKDRPGSQDEFYFSQAIIGKNGTVDSLIAQLREVTMEQVVAAARKITLDTVYFLKGVTD